MDFQLIDAIGPFFIGYQKRVVNWSKIPFVNLEKNGQLDQDKLGPILKAFHLFINKIASLGFNAITIDDLAHLVCFDFYPDAFKTKIEQYQDLYKRLFSIAADHKIKVFLNSDIMFYNEFIDQHLKSISASASELLHGAVESALNDFEIEGLAFRIGETDGEDVIGDFKSEILIKTPQQANQLIKSLMPVFEKTQKYLIFRNWTVGSYPIGDLIWNQDTHEAAFGDIKSPQFIVSLKYGDTDFFSRLELNPLFHNNSQKMILELQTRRERECFGVFPNYVGWDYEGYYEKLKGLKHLVGISVWCQTGGWSRNKNLTFIEDSTIWNELNTVAAINIFKNGLTGDEVILKFFNNNELYVTFLRRFNDIFMDLLYIDDFANQALYFRRTRIPPMLWLSWDYVTINPLITSIYMSFMKKEKTLDEKLIDNIFQLGKLLNIENIEYCYDTLRLFLLCRRTLLGQYEAYRLLEHIGLFRRKYHPCNFKFAIKKGNAFVSPVKIIFKIFTRKKPEYRFIDRILLNRPIAFIFFKLLMLSSRDRMPKFSNKRAMKLDTLFK